jgi:ribosomal protein S18 acetylase RimI-like enzyme
MTLAVRPAHPDEFAEIGRLTLAAYEVSGQLGPETQYRRALVDVAGRARDGTLLVAVDESTARPLGTVLFVLPGSRYAELARDGEAEFRMLAVAPGAQRRGVGRLLVADCLRRAADAGCTAVVICFRDCVESAYRLYTSMGFERLPERDWQPQPGVMLLGMRASVTGVGRHPQDHGELAAS